MMMSHAVRSAKRPVLVAPTLPLKHLNEFRAAKLQKRPLQKTASQGRRPAVKKSRGKKSLRN